MSINWKEVTTQRHWKNARESRELCKQADFTLSSLIDGLELVRNYLETDKKVKGRISILKSIKTILATKQPIEESGRRIKDGFIVEWDKESQGWIKICHSDFKDRRDKEIEYQILTKQQTKGDDLLKKGNGLFQPSENANIMGRATKKLDDIQKEDKQATKEWKAQDKQEKETAKALEDKLKVMIGIAGLTEKQEEVIIKKVIPVAMGKKKRTLKEIAKELEITEQGVKKHADLAWKKLSQKLSKTSEDKPEEEKSGYSSFIDGLGTGKGKREKPKIDLWNEDNLPMADSREGQKHYVQAVKKTVG